MADYTFTLNDTEEKCIDYLCLDTQEFVQNWINFRINTAKAEIIRKNLEHCNANDITIATGEDAQIEQAFTLGIVQTGADREAEYQAMDAAREAE